MQLYAQFSIPERIEKAGIVSGAVPFTEPSLVEGIPEAVKSSAALKVFVGGEVQSPGLVSIDGGLTLMGAIFQAGGFKSSAQLSRVTVLRKDANTEQPLTMTFDVNSALRGERPEANIALRPVLMENAGRTTYEILRREFPELEGPVAVVAGRGNNGGDGFVVARYLANAGFFVTVFLLDAKVQVKGDVRVNLEILERMGVEVVEVLSESDLSPVVHRLSRADLIVDALLGTGLNSPVQGLMAALIERLHHLRPPILAVDIPSGLSADTGEPVGAAVEADLTVTYGFPKIGQILPSGREHVGTLWVVDISIPPDLAEAVKMELAEAEEMRWLLPLRPIDSHKGTYGHLVVLAGAEGKTGAATLAAEGSLRAGAGLVTAACPASLNDILEVKLTEAMTLPLPEVAGARAFGRPALEPLLEFMAGKTALALGPGMGTHPETQELVCQVVRRLPQSLVIDADGVNCLSLDPKCLIEAAGPRLITPHPGELARLLGISPRRGDCRGQESRGDDRSFPARRRTEEAGDGAPAAGVRRACSR